MENTDIKNYTFVVKSGSSDVNYNYSKPLFHYTKYLVTKKNMCFCFIDFW